MNLASFADELEKVGGRAGFKMIKRLLREGTPESYAKAERLALTPGVLKKTRYGSQYAKDLGTGSEGVMSPVVHHKHGITARKLYNMGGREQIELIPRRQRIPEGITSRANLGKKEQFNKVMAGHPALPMQHGTAVTPAGHRIHFTEHVKGRELGKEIKAKRLHEERDKLEAIPVRHPLMNHLQLAAKQKGYEVGDLHPGNIMITPKGKPMAVDTVPIPKGEQFGQQLDERRLGQMAMGSPPRATGNVIKRQAFAKRVPKESDFARPLTVAERRKALRTKKEWKTPPRGPKNDPTIRAAEIRERLGWPASRVMEKMKGWFRDRAA